MTIATGLRTSIAVALSAHAIYQYQHDTYWWAYVPAYGLASIICMLPLPSLLLWRILSSVAVIGGCTLMVFLAWTLYSVEEVAGLELREARNLLPIAIGVALTGSTRLMSDTGTSLLKYPRRLILIFTVACSITIAAFSVKYFL
ncbi:hypothetical protein Q1695_010661 [Nippostrongylus brasiliensis]|nr:hypothetical protein Q1695_010661 [Nippostrongylus brasiliensis]